MVTDIHKRFDGEIDLGLQPAPPRSRLGELAWRTSNRLTHLISIACPRAFSLLHVAEYPRSGGTWLAHMLADYFQLPFPKYSRLPLACDAIVHTHLWYSPRLARAVFVQRDGRDIAVSAYFYLWKRICNLRATGQFRHHYFQLYPSLRDATDKPSSCRDRLADFIEDWWTHPVGCRSNWADYTASWTRNATNVVITSYEALRRDCVDELQRIIPSLTGFRADIERLRQTVERFSFKAQTGRDPGKEDASSNKRKGQVGDWRNYFSRRSAEVFNQRGGQLLIERGYESDDSWVSLCP